MKPPLFLRILVGRGVHGVIVVARVDRIDGEEVERAQVRAARQLRRLEPLHLGQHAGRKIVGDAVRVHGDEADAALVLRVAEHLGDARLGHAVALRARQLEADEIAVPGAPLVTPGDRPLLQLLAVDGVDQAAAAVLGAEDAELAPLLARQPLDRLGLVAVAEHVLVLEPRDARQDAVALPDRRLCRARAAARRQD